MAQGEVRVENIGICTSDGSESNDTESMNEKSDISQSILSTNSDANTDDKEANGGSGAKNAELGSDELPVADPELSRLLDFSCTDYFNEEAVVKIIKNNPSSSRSKYAGGTYNLLNTTYPLCIAIERGASFETVNIIYRAFPQAVKEIYQDGGTILHVACKYRPSLEVISLLLDEWPEAVSQHDDDGITPIFHAIQFGASLKVVSLLLERYPAAISSYDSNCRTCLHYACSNYGRVFEVATEVVTLLLETWPDAVKERDWYGCIPLHYACASAVPLDTALLLLEKWPAGVKEKDYRMKQPADYASDCKNKQMAVAHICRLVENNVDQSIVLQTMRDFIRLEWRGGIVLLFDLYPPTCKSLEDIPINIIPNLLDMIGGNCKLLTMYSMVRNRQDLLNVT